MSTIEPPEARGDGSRGFTSGSDAHADLVDIVLLLATILILMGVAAGIAIGFPLALEVAATHANAAAVVFPAPPLDARPLHRHQQYSTHRIGRGAPPGVASPDTGAPAPPLDARPLHRHQQEESLEEEVAPIIVDDIRSAELMHAAAPITAPFDRSTPQQSTTHR